MEKMNKPHVTAIILAGGSGSRVGAEMTKQRILICGQSMLYRSVKAFSDCESIDNIVVVCRADELEWAEDELGGFDKLYTVVSGGKTRAESARAGFLAIPDKTDFVAIHDGARCLVTEENISAVVECAIVHRAATACTAVTDTLKIIDADGMINKTMPREGLVCAQTPQVFERSLYAEALSKIDIGEGITDDNIIIEMLGTKIYPVDTGRQNIKITTAEDLCYAEYIIEGRKLMSEMRIGHGYDVHRLCEGRKLVLGGVDIPHEKGLLGHSDADVLTHAIMDALLGACAFGDIGRHFPDSDDSYKNISSLVLLDKVDRIITDAGFAVVNIDATLVIERPKIAPYINKMIENIAQILKIEQGRINIKATTEEGLGFSGREEGVGAYAVVTVKK